MSHKRENIKTLINRPDFSDAVEGSASWVREALRVVAELEYELERK